MILLKWKNVNTQKGYNLTFLRNVRTILLRFGGIKVLFIVIIRTFIALNLLFFKKSFFGPFIFRVFLFFYLSYISSLCSLQIFLFHIYLHTFFVFLFFKFSIFLSTFYIFHNILFFYSYSYFSYIYSSFFSTITFPFHS